MPRLSPFAGIAAATSRGSAAFPVKTEHLFAARPTFAVEDQGQQKKSYAFGRLGEAGVVGRHGHHLWADVLASSHRCLNIATGARLIVSDLRKVPKAPVPFHFLHRFPPPPTTAGRSRVRAARPVADPARRLAA